MYDDFTFSSVEKNGDCRHNHIVSLFILPGSSSQSAKCPHHSHNAFATMRPYHNSSSAIVAYISATIRVPGNSEGSTWPSSSEVPV